MSDYIRLGELVTLQRGTTYKGAQLGEPGPVLLGLGAIQRNGGFRDDNLKTYGGDSPAKLILGPGDLFLSLKDVAHAADLLGALARVPKHVAAGRLTQDTVRLDLTSDRVSSEYLYWSLRTPDYREYCRSHATGTTNLGLSREDFFAYRIPPPSLERVHMVHLLGALDDKITANTKLVESADGLSAATFASMLAETDSMPLTAVASFINGKAFTKNATGNGRVVIRIAELNSGIGGSTVYNDLDVPEQNLAKPGDLLFAWSGSLTLHRWYRPEGIVNQHIFKVVPNSGYPMWCVHGLIARKLDEFKSIAADKATTMGHIQRRHLDEPVNVPSQSQIKNHDVFMSALWECALAAEQESLTLEETRDALLPQLMLGNIRVKDVEKTVGEML
jgi:type I restriction enzyme S subunit